MVAAMDPAERLLEKASPRALLIMNSDFDSDQPKHYAIEFYRRLLPAYATSPERLRLAIYPAGHTVTPDMERGAVNWIRPSSGVLTWLVKHWASATLAARQKLDGFSSTHHFGKGVQMMRHKHLVALLSALVLLNLVLGACTAAAPLPAGETAAGGQARQTRPTPAATGGAAAGPLQWQAHPMLLMSCTICPTSKVARLRRRSPTITRPFNTSTLLPERPLDGSMMRWRRCAGA